MDTYLIFATVIAIAVLVWWWRRGRSAAAEAQADPADRLDTLIGWPPEATRKRRVAAGAGVQVQDVNRLLNQFEQMRDMMKKMKGGGLMKMMQRLGGMRGLKMPR